LASCCTGEGRKKGLNIANSFGRYINTVFAPVASVYLDQLYINPKNHGIEDVTYKYFDDSFINDFNFFGKRAESTIQKKIDNIRELNEIIELKNNVPMTYVVERNP
jgi:hypothetical protein